MPVDLTTSAFVPFLPECAEAAERRRKKRQAGAARGTGSEAPAAEPDAANKPARSEPAKAPEAKPPEQEAEAAKARPKPQMAQGAAQTQAAYEEGEADRKLAHERAVAQARADLLAKINAQMSSMYDPSLRGYEFAASLKEQLDLYYPERNGVHGPDAREQALQTEAFARSENAPGEHYL